jgi:hypothetical protein
MRPEWSRSQTAQKFLTATLTVEGGVRKGCKKPENPKTPAKSRGYSRSKSPKARFLTLITPLYRGDCRKKLAPAYSYVIETTGHRPTRWRYRVFAADGREVTKSRFRCSRVNTIMWAENAIRILLGGEA